MSVSYIIRESLSGFKRTKLSSFVSISTITLSLVLLGTFLLLAVNAQRLVTELRARLEIEVFLEKSVKQDEIKSIGEYLGGIKGVRETRFISREEAAAIFEQEFGENVFEILDTNPFPPSYRVFVRPEYGVMDSLMLIIPQIKKLAAVTDVNFNEQYISALDKNARILWGLTAGIGLIVGLASIFLVSNTIRLAIYSRRFLIQTMKLVGATAAFIRTPFLIEGFLQGVIGGLISGLTIFGLLTLTDQRIFPVFQYIVLSPSFFLTLLVTGAIFGLLGSVISVRKFISMRISE